MGEWGEEGERKEREERIDDDKVEKRLPAKC
jgi:hypothetical protein